MQKFITWLTLSSADETKFSLTLKGLAGFIPSAAIFLVAIHLNVSAGTLTDILGGIVGTLSGAAAIGTALVTLIGAIRKGYTSIAGTNAVINSN